MRSSAPCCRRSSAAATLAGGLAALALALTCGALVLACGAPAHGPFFGDDRLIVLGVDPEAEADALAKQLQARGLHEARRIRGKTFTALGFAPAAAAQGEQQSDVRVITGRGIALALEARAPTALARGERYALLPAPYRDTLDADGDGFDELFVSRTPLPSGERCTLVYRVRDSGFVDEVGTDDYTLVRVPDVADAAWQQPFCGGAAQAPDGGSPGSPSSPDGGSPPPQ
jgi:hypothetical protein